MPRRGEGQDRKAREAAPHDRLIEQSKRHLGFRDLLQFRNLEERLAYLRELEERRAAILASIEEQGKLTDALRTAIEAGADDKNLAAGDTISATQSAVVLENLISQFLFNKAAEPGGNNASAAASKTAPSKK